MLIEMEISRKQIIDSFPEWCDGVLIAPFTEGGEIIDYLVYPVRRSRDKYSYYFSDRWRRIKLPFILDLFNLAPCIMLRNGEVYGVSSFWRWRRYRYVEAYESVAKLLESGEVKRIL